MEGAEEALMSIIRKGSKTRTTTLGVVKSIDGTSCTVERNGLPDLEDVRLNAIIDDFENVFIVYPKVGSEVMVLQVEGAKEENVIVKYTEIDRVYIEIEGAVLDISSGKFEFKNKQANLKSILKDGFTQLKNAIIQTPSGPGSFSPNDKTVFENLKTKTNELFK